MTSPLVDPAITAEFVRAIVDNAKRLGLLWQIQPATVVDGDDPSATTVIFDGDAEGTQVPIVCLIGQLPATTRVHVVSVPGGGQYAIGGASQLRASGSVPFTFTAQTGSTQVVRFAKPFATIPKVMTNINSGAGAANGWGSRAFGISRTQFTLFVFGASSTWAGITVDWVAVP